MEWLEDFQDCLEGSYGQEMADRAEEWLEDNLDLPNDGTSWKHWREFRQSVAPINEKED